MSEDNTPRLDWSGSGSLWKGNVDGKPMYSITPSMSGVVLFIGGRKQGIFGNAMTAKKFAEQHYRKMMD